MLIRKAKKEDFEEYYKLMLDYNKYNNKIETFKDLTFTLKKQPRKTHFLKKLPARNRLLLVLDDGEKLQGFFLGYIEEVGGGGFLCKIKKMGYIGNVFITKKYRGKGYFKECFNEFSKFLKKKGVKYCGLHVDANNKAGLKAYKKFNFKTQEYKMIAKLK